MQTMLKGALVASLAGVVLAGAAFTATHMATLMASHAALSQAPAANPLLHPVLLKPDTAGPRGFSSGEKRNIEDAIRTQIRAYVARDAEQAFAKLAPSTQRFFGKPDKFLRSIARDPDHAGYTALRRSRCGAGRRPHRAAGANHRQHRA